MRLYRDERGAAIQVGASILLGFIVITITLYQVEAVPSQNQEIEFDHNQEVQNQMVELNDEVVGVVGGGSGGTQSVTLGTTYPARTIFVNPGPPSGEVRTTDSGAIAIENAEAVGEPEGVQEFWDGDRTWERSTRGIAYVPDYNVYDNAPVTVAEHGLVYNRHPNDANLTRTDQLLIEDDEITIVTVRGNLSESGIDSESIRTRALSTSTNTVSIEDADDPIEITLPTATPNVWLEELEDEDAVAAVSPDGSNAVEVELEPGTYDLRMAEVGVGDAERADPVDRASYLAVVDDGAPTATVEVRDELNNPVRNVPVTVEVNGVEQDSPTSTGSNGQVRVEEIASGDTIDVSVDGEEELDVTFQATGAEVSGEYNLQFDPDDQDDAETCDEEDECDFQVSQSLDDAIFTASVVEDINVRADVDWFLRDTDDTGIDFGRDDRIDDEFEDRDADVELDLEDVSEGLFDLGVATSSASTSVTVRVEDTTGFEIDVTDTNSPVEQGDDLEVTFDVENTGDETEEQEIVLEIDGTQEDSLQLELASGESSEGEELVWGVPEDQEPGEYTATVASEDDSDSVTVNVIEEGEGFFEVEITDTNSPLNEGETLEVSADITNEGENEETQDITLDIDGVGEDRIEDLTIAADETESITLEWETEDGDAGDYTAEVSSEDDSDSAEVSVLGSGIAQASATDIQDGEQSFQFTINEDEIELGEQVSIDLSQIDQGGNDLRYDEASFELVQDNLGTVTTVESGNQVDEVIFEADQTIDTETDIEIQVTDIGNSEDNSGEEYTVTFDRDGYDLTESDQFSVVS